MEVPLHGHDGSLAKSAKERGVAAAREEGWARRDGLHDLHEGGPCVSTAASSAANQGGATHAPGPIVAPRFRPWSRLVLRPTSTTTPPHRGPSSGGHPSSAACPSSTPSFLACPCSPQILGAWGRLTRARASHLGFRGTHASHGAMFRFVDFWGRFPVPKSHQKRLRKANRVRGFDMDGPTGSMTELGDLCQECVCSLGEV